ncbi:uncharacterized protein, partial [Anas platyrhynchos]|uniref:uncharacterized protein n=1 Tax=Anas platyrhynchos TaxID=8839 RepID=UPI003AF242E6
VRAPQWRRGPAAAAAPARYRPRRRLRHFRPPPGYRCARPTPSARRPRLSRRLPNRLGPAPVPGAGSGPGLTLPFSRRNGAAPGPERAGLPAAAPRCGLSASRRHQAQAGKKAPGAASGSAAPPPVPGVRRRAAGDPRGQLAELREKIRGLEDDNRQLREQLQHSRAREEELEGQVSSLRTELQQSQEERSRWQREAEAQAAERQRLAAELQERHRQLEELREAARDREEQLGAAQAELREVSGALSRREAEVSELRALAGAQEEHLHALEMERRRLHNQLQELKGNIRVFCRVRPLLAAEQEAQKGLEHLHFPPEDNKTLVLCRTEGSHTGRRGEVRYDFSFDRVFPPGASQEDVFEEIALLVQSALDGYPVCIFADGQRQNLHHGGAGGRRPHKLGGDPLRRAAPLRGRPPAGAQRVAVQFQRQLPGDLQRGAAGPAGGGQGGRAGDPPRQLGQQGAARPQPALRPRGLRGRGAGAAADGRLQALGGAHGAQRPLVPQPLRLPAPHPGLQRLLRPPLQLGAEPGGPGGQRALG